ncbi:YveK family protein [Bacillaceae bacterium W0354]
MEETISLKEILEVIKKRIKLIILITFLAAFASAVFTIYFITPTYQSSSQFIVSQKESVNEYNVNEIRTNVELINTYNVIIKSPAILDYVIQELNLNLSVNQLANMINVSNASGSQVVNVTVTNTDPYLAANIANTTVEVFQKQIPILMNVDNVNILSTANVGPNPAPVSPNIKLNIAIAIVLGVMVSVGLAFLLEFFDNSIKSEQDIENILDLPVMGVISTISSYSAPSVNKKREQVLESRGVKVGS